VLWSEPLKGKAASKGERCALLTDENGGEAGQFSGQVVMAPQVIRAAFENSPQFPFLAREARRAYV
jgi:hypothetical protein